MRRGRACCAAASISPRFSRISGGIQSMPEGGVNLFLGGRGDDGFVVEPGERPLAQRVAHFEGALAQGDVVRLGAGKVLQRRAVGLRGQQAHVDLQAVVESGS